MNRYEELLIGLEKNGKSESDISYVGLELAPCYEFDDFIKEVLRERLTSEQWCIKRFCKKDIESNDNKFIVKFRDGSFMQRAFKDSGFIYWVYTDALIVQDRTERSKTCLCGLVPAPCGFCSTISECMHPDTGECTGKCEGLTHPF